MKKILIDKISSSTKNIPLQKEAWISDEIISKPGYVLAGKIHGIKTSYNKLENCSGRFIQLQPGDVVAGALGHRDALKGYSGVIPESIAVGDTLQILNLGGVVGKYTSGNPSVGKPFDFEVLGSILTFPDFQSRKGEIAHVKQHAIRKLSENSSSPQQKIPVIYIAATCMHAGKTSAATSIIRGLRDRGITVGACKLTGVSLLRDTLEMLDYGASTALSFMDDGVVTTNGETAVKTTQKIMNTLMEQDLDIIVAELGDGLLGTYGVKEILASKELMELGKILLLCANDPVGAWGAVELLKKQYNLKPDIISGPTTDNLAGIRFIKDELNIPGVNARHSSNELIEIILKEIQIES